MTLCLDSRLQTDRNRRARRATCRPDRLGRLAVVEIYSVVAEDAGRLADLRQAQAARSFGWVVLGA